jgi:hypothetical protein
VARRSAAFELPNSTSKILCGFLHRTACGATMHDLFRREAWLASY